MPGIHNGIGTTFRSQAFGGAPSVNPDFVSTWDTTKAGSASNTVVLPLLSGGTYNGTIDWGDGNSDTLSYANRTHVYASSGTYTITISGSDIQGFQFNNAGDRRKITDISNWGNLTLTAAAAFYGCNNLDISATDAPTISTTNLTYTFRDCTSLTTPDFSSWDVSGVTDMGAMFIGCVNFNGDVTTWDVSNVTRFCFTQAGFLFGMFDNCQKFNQPIGSWDVSSATQTFAFFRNCYVFNQDLSNWDMSNKTDLRSMFQQCRAFNNDGIKNWDVSNVQFFGATNDADGFGMFSDCWAFNQPIGSWDMSSAVNIGNMFRNASSFNQDLGAWNLSNCTSIYRTFDGFNRVMSFNNGGSDSINNWDVSNVSNFGRAFRNCDSFDRDISNWDITGMVSAVDFMSNATGLSTSNYDALLIGWEATLQATWSGGVGYPYTININFGGSKYTAASAAATARASLVTIFGWTITDGGAV